MGKVSGDVGVSSDSSSSSLSLGVVSMLKALFSSAVSLASPLDSSGSCPVENIYTKQFKTNYDLLSLGW